MREPTAILADMRRARAQLAALGGEYAAALYAKHSNGMVKKPTRWHGHALEALRAEYEGTPRTLSNLADRHHTSAGNICNLAKQHGWVRHELNRRLQPRWAAARPVPVEHQRAE